MRISSKYRRRGIYGRRLPEPAGIHESVKRGNKIRVKYLDEDLVEHDEIVEGYLARVMQHEFDHLDGKMFIDHLSPLRRQMSKGKTECHAER